jgi:hypothetical protein
MDGHNSPWLKVNSQEAGAYARRGGRALRKAVKDGKLRAAVIGAKRELLTRREWLDAFIEADATPVTALTRRRA